MRKVAPTNSTTGDSYFLVVVYYRLCRLNCRRRRRRGIHFAGQIRRPAERERPLWSLDVARCNDAALLYFRFEFQLSPFLSLSLCVSVFLSVFPSQRLHPASFEPLLHFVDLHPLPQILNCRFIFKLMQASNEEIWES